MNRRTVLALATSAAAGVLGGCTTPDDGGDGDPVDGQWTLRARVHNADDQPREWRVESRAEGRNSVVSAAGRLPAGERTELALSGQLVDEQREVYAESERGAQGVPWQLTACRTLAATVIISDGMPSIETTCRES